MLAPMRGDLALAIAAIAAGCGGGQSAGGAEMPAEEPTLVDGGTPPHDVEYRREYHCTPKSNGADEEAGCRAKGCRYGPPLVCIGTPPPPEIEQGIRKQY